MNILNLVLGLFPIVFARWLAATTHRHYMKIGFDALSERALVHCFRGVGIILIGFEIYLFMELRLAR
ncbi:MAG: hypothetical protein EOP87_12855 [Verrucomicrobiaceae bacterium]|nr:MAG: hypothetical protein EOP87_12855 [Verrucomicrobiaceae bacterium]